MSPQLPGGPKKSPKSQMGMKIHGKCHPWHLTMQNPALATCINEEGGVRMLPRPRPDLGASE